MRLDEVCQGIEYRIEQGSLATEITGICYDSRQVRPGNLFVCIVGEKTDGHLFAQQAVESGAAAILAERKVDIGKQVALVITSDTRAGLSQIAANYYGHPSR